MCKLVESAGYRCTIGNPELDGFSSLNGIHGPLPLNQVEVLNDVLMVNGVQPDFILLNNDLTDEGLQGLSLAHILPNPQMGWHKRKKSMHFEHLRPFIEEVCEIIDIEPW